MNQFGAEREQMEEAAFQDYTQKMQEINATLERISLHSLLCPLFVPLTRRPPHSFQVS